MLMLFVLLLLAACSNNTTNGTANTSEEKNLFIGMVNPPIAFNTINSSDVASQYIEGFPSRYARILEIHSKISRIL